MRLIPLLLRPTFLSFRNLWLRRDERHREMVRGVVLTLLTAGVMLGAYLGGLWVLEQMRTQIDFAYFHSSLLLGLILFFLLMLLLLTNTIGAVSSLFLSRDLNLLVASPLSVSRFFFGKFIELLISSSWMTVVFIAPVIAMFASFYGAGWSFAGICVLTLLPYFIIPSALAIVLAHVLAVVVPLHRKRELFTLVLLAGLGLLLLLGRTVSVGFEDDARIDLADILQLISLLSVANRTWSPSNWVAVVLGEQLEPTGQPVREYILLLYAVSIACCCLAFLAVRLLHFEGLSRQGLGNQGARINSRRSQRRIERLLGWLSPQSRSLVVKEWKTASRDVTQSVNIILLLGFFALYLYMLTFQNMFRQMFGADQQRWWRMFLLVTNICLESFVITAMGTRLVFPSVSRESHAYWVLQTAPLTVQKILRVKFLFWFVVVASVTSIFFGIASYLAYASLAVVLLKFVLNLLLCIAIVGLGIGLGAYFANFNWEHPSQLTTGFGSLVFMLTGVSLMGVTLVLTACAVWFGRVLPRLGGGHWYSEMMALLTGGAVPVLTIGAAFWALKAGERALINRR